MVSRTESQWVFRARLIFVLPPAKLKDSEEAGFAIRGTPRFKFRGSKHKGLWEVAGLRFRCEKGFCPSSKTSGQS